jgi:MFS family permease
LESESISTASSPQIAEEQNIFQPKKLFNRNFLLVLQAQLVSRTGSQLTSMAVALWIKDVTGSATLMGLLLMIGNLPSVILAPIGGVIADRYSRKKIIIFSDLFRAFDVLLFAALLFIRPQAERVLLVGLFSLVLVNSVINSFFASALTAMIPDLVPEERLPSANTLSQLSIQLSTLFGQGLGGVAYRLLGAPLVFLLNSFSFFYAGISESFIKVQQKIPERPRQGNEQFAAFIDDIVVGLRYIWKNAGLRVAIIVTAFSSFFAVPVITLLPFYVDKTLQVSVDWYGYIIAASTIGAVLGYILAGFLRLPGRPRSILILVFLFLQSAGYVLLGFVSNPTTALVLAVLGGISGGYIGVNLTSILQAITPAEMRGRVFSMLAAVTGALAPIAMGLSGIVADLLNQNIPLVYIGCGLGLVIVSTFAILNADFRRFLAYEFHRN